MSHFVRAFIVLLSIVFLLSAKSLANPGQDTTITLPDHSAFTTPQAGFPYKFVVPVQQVNRNSEEYAVDDSMGSSFGSGARVAWLLLYEIVFVQP